MSQTDVDICNLGLVAIGSGEIQSLVPPIGTSAKRCARFYEQTIRAEIRKKRWHFATRFETLESDPTAVHPNRKYGFLFGPDVLRIIRPQRSDWEIQGRYIFTDQASPLTAKVLKRVLESEFDPSFVDVAAYSLAMRLCEVQTQSGSKYQNAAGQYKMALQTAAACNAFERGPEFPPDSSWVDARYFDGGYVGRGKGNFYG